MIEKREIQGGLYLVLDPSMAREILFLRLKAALEGGVQLLQIWNNWSEDFDQMKKRALINDVVDLAKQFVVPVLINEEWELLQDSALSGVHFDQVPADYASIKNTLSAQAIVGITCGNDLKVVEWADRQGLDYISFCAMFPSASAGVCEIVSPETVKQAGLLTDLPLFVSGGITPENITELKELDIAGVAVISGILSHSDPKQAALTYSNQLKELRNERFTVK